MAWKVHASHFKWFEKIRLIYICLNVAQAKWVPIHCKLICTKMSESCLTSNDVSKKMHANWPQTKVGNNCIKVFLFAKARVQLTYYSQLGFSYSVLFMMMTAFVRFLSDPLQYWSRLQPKLSAQTYLAAGLLRTYLSNSCHSEFFLNVIQSFSRLG